MKKRYLMTIAGVLNTLLFICALGGGFYLIYLGGKVVYDALQLGMTSLNGFTALIFVLSTLVTGVMLLIGIAAAIFSGIMLANSKALIKKAKLPDEQFAKRKGGIKAYIFFCLLLIGGAYWFLQSEIIKSTQNSTFVYVLIGIMVVLSLSIVLIIADMGKKINSSAIPSEMSETKK